MNKKILKINLCLAMLFIIITFTFQTFATGIFSLNKSSATITEGETSSFTIDGSGATGRIDISSSDTNVATVSSSSEWIENNSKSITITAKKAGSTTITVSGTVADKDGEEATVTKTISVTVKAPVSNNNTSTTTKEPKFTSVNQTMYTTGEVNIRKSYSTSSTIIKTVDKGTKITVTGIGDNGWSKITYNGQTVYISSSLLTKTKPVEEKPVEEPKDNNTVNGTNNSEAGNNEIPDNTNSENTDENNTIETTSENLKLSKLEITGVNFTDGFNPDIHSYALKLNFFVKNLNITAEANKPEAKIEIIGNENFVEGENNITILVTSADNKETLTYQIKVTIPAEIAAAPQNNIQFYLMCGTIILMAIVVIIIITSIYKKKKNKNDANYNDIKINDNEGIYENINSKKEKVKTGKHSN